MSVIIKTDSMEIDNSGYWITTKNRCDRPNNAEDGQEKGFHIYHNPELSQEIDNLLEEIADKAKTINEMILKECRSNPMSDDQWLDYEALQYENERAVLGC